MRLPSGERAVVEDRKLLEYVLNPDHPTGRHHAWLFQMLLGITRANHEILREALLRAARSAEVEPGRESEYGQKYEMRVPMSGPHGEKVVVAVWLIEKSADRPRLITCYVE